jgi:hypothetical protein
MIRLHIYVDTLNFNDKWEESTKTRNHYLKSSVYLSKGVEIKTAIVS